MALAQISIKAIRFQYVKVSDTPWNFETMPFYTRYLRSFLYRNNGKATWVKGARVKREAYLIFYSELEDEIIRLMSQPLADLGSYKVTIVQDPIKLLKECITENRIAIGELNIFDKKLGETKRPTINVKMRDNYCLICPHIENGKCALEGYHGSCIIEKPFIMDGNYGTIHGNLQSCERIMVIMNER